MCNFISTESIAPGWGCCACRIYNGLQRKDCRNCLKTRHVIEVPPEVVQCEKCGFGALRGHQFQRTLDGRDVRGVCPNCEEPWPTEEVVH